MLKKNINRLLFSGAFFFLLPLLMNSCGNKTVYEDFKTLPETGWVYADSLSYNFAIQDTNKLYELWLNVDHTTSFSYRNLYLMIQTKFPDGETQTDRVTVDLMDPKSGLWLGKCKGENCSTSIVLQDRFYFQQTGDHTISIEQYTRDEPLKGIRGMGIALVDTGEGRPK